MNLLIKPVLSLLNIESTGFSYNFNIMLVTRYEITIVTFIILSLLSFQSFVYKCHSIHNSMLSHVAGQFYHNLQYKL